MRIIAASFLLAILSFTMACPTAKPVTTANDASDGAATDGVTLTACHQAQIRLGTFNCPESITPDGGESYEQVCMREQVSHEFNMHSDCIAKAMTLDDVRACGVVCKK